ncbi:MAG: PAS domain S-box protein [Desulfarculaceae bacterium]|nr:PAS domain S-box protein [Desulfarculaceae bacterium]
MPLARSILLLGLPPKLQQEISDLLRGQDSPPRFSHAHDQAELAGALDDPPELIIAYNDGPCGAREVLNLLERRMLIRPVVVLDPRPSQEVMTELLRLGAADYLGINQLDLLEAVAVKALNRMASRQHMVANSEGRYRTLVETMKDGLMSVDTNGVITFANPALAELLGYSEAELVGGSLFSLVEKDGAEFLKGELAKRRQGSSSSYELEVTTKDGRRIPIFVSASPLLREDGECLGSMAIYTDLSELRRAEAEVSKAATEWRQCFDSLEDLLVVIDKDFKVQRCNKAMRDYLGLNYSEIVGQSCYQLMHGAYAPPEDCLQNGVLQDGKMCSGDFQDPNSGRLFAVTLTPVTDDRGEVQGTVHLFKDVTEHRKREQERNELTMALNRGLEATTLALTNMVDSRDPYTSGHSQRVAELAVQVGGEMGLSDDDLTGLKYCGLLHDIGKGAIPLDILNRPGRLTDHEMGIIREHPATAFRILENISFPWPVARVVYEHHERIDGSGYPQGLKGEEIHPWARLLAVCDVVEAMTSHRPYRPAHSIHEACAVLEQGSGTHFDPEVVEAALSILGLEDRRVTVVDDDPGVLNVYCSFLKREAYDIVSFNDPVEAIEKFAQSPTPILVTDLKMPGKGGLEVLQDVKRMSPDTEVIVITGHGDKESVVAAMRMGASDFLEKPVQMAELQQAVKRARERYNKET